MNKIFLSLLLILLFFSVEANMSRPIDPDSSTVTGEFQVKDPIAVKKEFLNIDLRPLASKSPVKVSATYLLHSDTSFQKLEVVFVAHNLKENFFTITVNGKTIHGEIIELDSIPASWAPPDSLQWQSAKYRLNYSPNNYIRFFLPVVEGENKVEVEYIANAGSYFTGGLSDPTSIVWNFIYILAPAKNWKSFGELQLQVTVPEHWEVESNLALSKEKNVWRGSWKNIPSDYLTLSAKQPDTAAIVLGNTYLYGGWILILILSFWLLTKIAKFKVAKKAAWWKILFLLLTIAFSFTFFFFLIYMKYYDFMKLLLGDQAQPNSGKTAGYAVIGAPFIFALAFAVAASFHLYWKKILRAKQK